MLKIGLTGGIGSGKTTVSDLFEKLEIPVIDTDIIARELVRKNTQVLKNIAEHFGDTVISNNGELKRQHLASIVFKHPEKKQQLENILHPEIREQIKHKIQIIENNRQQSSKPEGYCIVVIPLLFETGFDDLIDRTLVLIADEQTRVQRIKKRDNRNPDEIYSIIRSQVSDEIRLKKSDDIIKNNSNISNLEEQVLQLHEKYSHLARLAL